MTTINTTDSVSTEASSGQADIDVIIGALDKTSSQRAEWYPVTCAGRLYCFPI